MSPQLTAYRRRLVASLGLAASADAMAALPLSVQAPADLLTGTKNAVDVRGATPGARVYLVGGTGIGMGPCPTPVSGVCLDLVGAVLLAEGRADAGGTVHFDVLIPSTIDDGRTLHLQAVELRPTARTSLVVSGTTDHPPRVCGERPEVEPGVELWSTSEWMLCAPLPASGSCPTYSALPYAAVQDQLYRRADLAPDTGGGFDAQSTCDETSVEDRCCYGVDVFEWVVGRPFLVDGKARVAAEGHDPSWSTRLTVEVGGLPADVRARAARRWSEIAHGEHASVASFARFQLHLLQLGAPADLVAETTRAMADEIQHARDAFAIASALAGEVRAPGPMPLDGAGPSGWEGIVRAAVREGCIAETIAAAQVERAASRCTTPGLADALRRTADDEARHATLAWRFVRWALTERPELAWVLREEVSAPLVVAPAAPEPDAAWDDALGLLSRAEGDEVATAVFHDVVRPTALLLLSALPAVA